jgi:hypothetical protein
VKCYIDNFMRLRSCIRNINTGLDDYIILEPEHLVGSRLGGMHDSSSIQNLIISRLRMFKCQTMCRATDRYFAQIDLRET